MKFLIALTLFFTQITLAQVAKIDVQLSPAGSFEAQGKVVGSLKKIKGMLVGKNIRVPIKSLETGIELRDSHLQKRLRSKRVSSVAVLKAKGKGGKGIGIISVKGIKRKFKFTYKLKGKVAHCQFKLSLKKFKIQDISYLGVGVVDEVTIKAEVPVK